MANERDEAGDTNKAAMRLDRLLVYLRFARTRSGASRMIGKGTLRRNRIRVERASEKIAIGDVLTLMIGNRIRVIEITSLPERRGPPDTARGHYRELDPGGGLDLAAAPNEKPSPDRETTASDITKTKDTR